MILAGDTQALHARLLHASDAHFSGKSFSFRIHGESKTIARATLLGWQATEQIYAVPGAYLQFLPNGSSITTTAGGRAWTWTTDGTAFYIARNAGPEEVWQAQDLHLVAGVPAETRLTIRLLEPLSSRTAKIGTKVPAREPT
jgi:hypothetical protein